MKLAKTKQRKSDILNGRGLELFDLLRELRTTIAREENIPPYLVFSDKTLVDMCVKLPFTKEEMLSVSGVGENKSRKYGERFAKGILDFTNGKREKLYFGEVEEVRNRAEHSKTGKETGKTKTTKQDFFLTAQQAIEFPYEEKYLVTEIAEQLNRLRNPDMTKKITGAEIFRFIMSKELASQTFYGRMPKKEVSEKGVLAGLFLGPRISKTGTEYQDIYYNEQAQSMIVEHYTRDKNS